jgi:hypothetical protein
MERVQPFLSEDILRSGDEVDSFWYVSEDQLCENCVFECVKLRPSPTFSFEENANQVCGWKKTILSD